MSSRPKHWHKTPPIANHRKHLDLSAFIVVAWCIFHNMRALKFSMVVRTIITDATIYFLAMVTLQIYSQLSFIFMEVLSLSPRLHFTS